VGEDIIYETIKEFPTCTIITGAPLTNVGNAIRKCVLCACMRGISMSRPSHRDRMDVCAFVFSRYPDLVIERWVAQGGFAGDNIVPPGACAACTCVRACAP
jgi:hypothetical protein